ncbi:Juvenile hormone esterase [Anthophora quadrimaculata]
MHRSQRGHWTVDGLICKDLIKLLVMFLLIVSGIEVTTTKVLTKFGPIRGLWNRSTRGRLMIEYLGVPYAEPPVGDLRFRSPQPLKHTWNDTYGAYSNGNMCIQLGRDGKIHGSEDCLFLNIFVPMISGKPEKNSSILPVVVFVHGGSFMTGTGDSHKFPPKYLMDQNIILVTLNYRLNILGFLSTASKASPGNYGLKDIRMALQWIQENIASFNGDPNSVTLWGHSAGAVLVHELALSEKTEGLFHRYILQSASAFSPWALNTWRWVRKLSMQTARFLRCLPREEEEEDEIMVTEGNLMVNSTTVKPEETIEKEEDYVKEENYDEEQEEEIMQCLRKVESNKFVEVIKYYKTSLGRACCPFGPTIEAEAEDAIITMHPLVSIKSRTFRDIPFIMGAVSDEGLLNTIDILLNVSAQIEMVDNFETQMPYLLEYYQLISNWSGFTKAIEDFYFGGNVTLSTLRENITKVTGDSRFNWGTYQTLKYHSEVMNSNIYFYFFSYEGTFSVTFKTGSPVHYGVAHVDDLNYLIPLLNEEHKGMMLHNTENDVTVINIMTEMWASFATKGVPEAWRVMSWPEYKETGEFLRFGDGKNPDINVGSGFFSDRMDFWNDITENLTDSVNFDLIIEPIIKEEEPNTGISHKHNKLLPFLLIFFAVCWLNV